MTVSLVTYRHPLAAVRAVVDAIMKSENVERFYVIDNAGETELGAELATAYPQVAYIPLDNPGFGTAHNVAIRKAMMLGARYHVIVNPDIYFETGTLQKIVEFMDAHPQIGLVMPKTVNVDGSLQYNCKLCPGPMDLIVRRFLPKRWTAKRNDFFMMKWADYEKTMEVPYLCGCFMCFRVEALKQVGLFDERFFMYPEDIDITRRMWSGGWHPTYYPEAVVTHAHEAASYKSFKMLKIHVWNMIKYFNKWGWLLDPERRRINREVLKERGV